MAFEVGMYLHNMRKIASRHYTETEKMSCSSMPRSDKETIHHNFLSLMFGVGDTA